MAYDPRSPHAERYIKHPPRYSKTLLYRVEQDALKLCRALGYDLNTVEFAVENGIPYAIDFMNPVPDADLNSVGEANFDWIVRTTADLAIAKARTCAPCPSCNGRHLLGTSKPKTKRAKKEAADNRSNPAAR